jgi:hypothetical protein
MNIELRHTMIFLIMGLLVAATVVALAFTNPFHLLSAPTTTSHSASVSGLEIVTSNGARELTLLRGCTSGQILAFSNSQWGCASTSGVTGAAAASITLDLDNDAALESAGITEIATTGDSAGCFTEPSDNKLLIDVGCEWPLAATATALAANGANCAAGSYPLGVDQFGAAESCGNNISGNSATATALAANGANCSAGSFPLGVDAAGAVESCSTSITGNSATTTALAANGSNCSAGNYPLGVDASGNAESCTSVTGSEAPQYKRVTSNVSIASSTLTDITGLDTFSVTGSQVYIFHARMFFTTANASEGMNWAVNCTCTVTHLRVTQINPSNAPANSNQVSAGPQQTANNTAIFAMTSGSGATPAAAYIDGLIEVGASSGVLSFRHASETGLTNTTERGSYAVVELVP